MVHHKHSKKSRGKRSRGKRSRGKRSRGKRSHNRNKYSRAGMMKRSSSSVKLPRWETLKEITIRESPTASEKKGDNKLYGGQEFLVSETKIDKFNDRVFWKISVNTRDGHKEGWIKPTDNKGNWNVRTTNLNQLAKIAMIN